MKNEHYNAEERDQETPTWKDSLKAKLNEKPKQILMLMILILTISVVINVIIEFSRKGKPKQSNVSIGSVTAPMSDGFGQLINAGMSIYELKELEKEIELIMAKEKWTSEDSLKIKVAYNKIRNYRP